jgi:hypothetical protein
MRQKMVYTQVHQIKTLRESLFAIEVVSGGALGALKPPLTCHLQVRPRVGVRHGSIVEQQNFRNWGTQRTINRGWGVVDIGRFDEA